MDLTKLSQLLTRRHRPDVAALSALADETLDGGEAKRLEAHVAMCRDCRERLEALQRVRALLQTLPEAEAPRSFRLSAAQARAATPERAAGARAPSTWWQGWLRPALPALSGVSLAVFAVLLAVDVSRSGSDAIREDASAMRAADADEAQTAARTGDLPPAGESPSAPAGAPNAFAATPDLAARNADSLAPAAGATGGDTAPAAPTAAAPAPVPVQKAAATAADGADQTEATSAPEQIEDDEGNALRIAEIAAAALAIAAGGAAAFIWTRRRSSA